MDASEPKTTWQWNVTGQEGMESLKYTEQDIPPLGDNEVLVKSKRYNLACVALK